MNYDALMKTGLTNYEGGEAFPLSQEMELYTAVVTSALAPTTYEGVDRRVERICNLVKQCDDKFVAQLAIYARQVMNLRSIPLLLVVELARKHNGDDLVARTVAQVVRRADEIMELLTCYQWRNPAEGYKKLGRLSRQIQNGLQMAFNNFDEYQFAKYNNSSRQVKLRDALFLVHPKAKDETQQAIFDKIASDSLATPYTWEVELSALGKQQFDTPEEKQAAVTAKWQELIESDKLGYMALMRNLRNILQCQGMPAETMAAVGDRLSDPAAIAKARQLPFRYLAAYREIATVHSMWTQNMMDALELAVMHTAGNITGFDQDTRVVVAADVSGSMCHPVSPRSSIHCYDIGLMLAMMFKNRCRQVISGIFGNTWKVVNLPGDGILSNVIKLREMEGEVGYATNGHKVIEYLRDEKIVTDKVLIFTDCQLWNTDNRRNYRDADTMSLRTAWHDYKRIAPDASLYIFDLAGYGMSPISLAEKDVYLIGGWSEKIFDVLDAIENGESQLSKIKNIPI